MSILDIVGTVFIGGSAIVMTAITVGPFYFLFVAMPQMQQAARKEHFLKLRRTLRKERAKKRRLLQDAAA